MGSHPVAGVFVTGLSGTAQAATPLSGSAGIPCALAWDPNAGDWKIFDPHHCNRYSPSFWNGWGYYLDNQSGSVLTSFTPDGVQHDYNWEPVWSIRNC